MTKKKDDQVFLHERLLINMRRPRETKRAHDTTAGKGLLSRPFGVQQLFFTTKTFKNRDFSARVRLSCFLKMKVRYVEYVRQRTLAWYGGIVARGKNPER